MDELTHLLLAARDGDRAALTELVTRIQPDVWRFCAFLGGAAQADDLTQDTFLRVWQSARTFRAEASAKTWVLAVARRACYDANRRATRRRSPASTPPEAAADSARGDPSGEVVLADLIDRLDPDRRAAFVLTQVLDLSYREAADVLGCPIGTVRSRLARARADLFSQLGPTDRVCLTDHIVGK